MISVHFDDVLTGGKGQYFEEVLSKLRAASLFENGRNGLVSSVGHSFNKIRRALKSPLAEKLRKPKLRLKEEPSIQVNAEEVTSLRSCLGGALWLAKRD